MDFNWINLFDGIIVIIMLIPNIVYVLSGKKGFSSEAPKALVVLEQISRYGCMILMVVPLLVWKFGFASADFSIGYFVGNGILLIIYIGAWLFFFQKRSRLIACFLCVTPSLIFILSGICLSHYLLIGFGLLFGVCHTWISMITFIPEEMPTKKLHTLPYIVLITVFAALELVLPVAYFVNAMSYFTPEDVKFILFFSQPFPIPLLVVFALLLDRAIKLNREIEERTKEND